jgi:hypothetical protein
MKILLKSLIIYLLLSSWSFGLAMTATNYLAHIHGVRIWPSTDNTRVVFDVSESPKYKVSYAHNEKKIIIQFYQSRLNGKLITDLMNFSFSPGKIIFEKPKP